MRIFEEYKRTTNPTVYRRLHKFYTAGCTYCRYHRGENHDGYHGKNPSWKMVSRKPNQWEGKVTSQRKTKKYSKFLAFFN
jgi:hypothetical protein